MTQLCSIAFDMLEAPLEEGGELVDVVYDQGVDFDRRFVQYHGEHLLRRVNLLVNRSDVSEGEQQILSSEIRHSTARTFGLLIAFTKATMLEPYHPASSTRIGEYYIEAGNLEMAESMLARKAMGVPSSSQPHQTPAATCKKILRAPRPTPAFIASLEEEEELTQLLSQR
ncbi:hypothetical protein BGZ81_004181 [Podila clonocystis]|nr:hypothetical protein BGZ81_004181 [Podila clonocystis]